MFLFLYFRCVFGSGVQASPEIESCSLLLLIGDAGSCSLGIEDNSLLHAKWARPALVALAALLLLFS